MNANTRVVTTKKRGIVLMSWCLLYDVDGYMPVNTGSIEKLVEEDAKDGFRPRELAYSFFHSSGGRSEIGSIFYVDDKDVAPLPLTKNVQWVHDRLHGLPVNPTVQTWGDKARVHESSRLLADIRALVERFRTAHPLTVLHKGGPEGKWAARMCPGVPTYNLEDSGCPKADVLDARDLRAPDIRGCGHHAHGLTRHCPEREVALFEGWWKADPAARPVSVHHRRKAKVPAKLDAARCEASAAFRTARIRARELQGVINDQRKRRRTLASASGETESSTA